MRKKIIWSLVIILGILLTASLTYIFIKSRASADVEKIDSTELTDLTDAEMQIEKANFAQKTAPESNEIIVKYKNISDDQKTKIASSLNLKENPNKKIEKLNSHVYSVAKSRDKKNIIDKLNKTGMVEYAEINATVYPEYVPNDPLYSQQWHHPVIKTPAAWDSTQGNGVTIGVLDTGVDCAHPDLAASCFSGIDLYYNDNDPNDIIGHGTKVAGTATGIGDNTNQVAGVSYKSKILPVKIGNDTTGTSTYTIISNGIIWAADNGAKIINISYAPLTTSSTIIDATRYAYNKGAVVVVGAGNSNLEECTLGIDEMVVAASTGKTDAKSSFSSFGIGVDVGAPGELILTTTKGGGTASVSGTSFSSPVTAGTLALMSSLNSSLTPAQLIHFLLSSAKDLGTSGFDKYFGWGRVDAGAAILTIKNGQPDSQAPTSPTNLTTAIINSSQIKLTWTASTDNIGVIGYQVFRDNSQIGITAATTFTDTTALANISYKYVVKAYDQSVNISPASNESTIIIVDKQPPTAPTNLTATIGANNSVNLNWIASTDNVGVKEYYIYRDNTTIGRIPSTSYSDTTVQLGSTYTYSVRATDLAGLASPVSNSVTIIVNNSDTTAPTAPTNLQVSLDGAYNIQLTWTASTDNVGVSGYQVFRNNIKIDDVITNYTVDNTVAYETPYSYYVKAYDAAGNISAQSNIVTVTVPTPNLLKITSYQVTNITNNSAKISWTTNSNTTGVVSYGQARRSINLSSSKADLTNSVNHNITLSNLRKGTRYSFEIIATNSNNSLDNVKSPIDFFTTAAR